MHIAKMEVEVSEVEVKEVNEYTGFGDMCAGYEYLATRIKLVRAPRPVGFEGTRFASAGEIYRAFKGGMADLDREMFVCLYLDHKNRVDGVHVVSVGSLAASLVHPREVFKGAMLANAAAIIVLHNHPSGDPTPSLEDRTITARLRAAGEILGIVLLDHVVVGADGFRSFSEAGLL
jgi:DNA repair protein RadC